MTALSLFSIAKNIGGFALAGTALAWFNGAINIGTIANLGKSDEEITASEQSVYYTRCDAVRAAGKAPLYRGSPGYRRGMDSDGDGIACEPYRRF